MPYLRLYSRDVPLDEKRELAQKLISITLRAFHLRPEERDQITVQFVRRPPKWALHAAPPGRVCEFSEVLLEVANRDLTVEKVTAFVEEAEPVLRQSKAVKGKGPIARLLRLGADPSAQVAFQFDQMDSAEKKSEDDFVVTVPLRKAA